MSLATNLQSLATDIGTEIKKTRTSLGDLASLKTAAKTSLVAAVNELYDRPSGGGGAEINDAVTNTVNVWSSSKTDAEIKAAVAALVDGAPAALDTLNELAAALGDDPNFATTIAAQIGGKANAVHTHTLSQISDATTFGRALMMSANGADARTSIGAGTSNLALGTTSTTAKAGDYQPTAAQISDATATGRSVLTAASAAAARTAIGAGTGSSNLAIGTTSTTAKAGDYQPAAANISDGTAVGRSLLTTASAATARTTLDVYSKAEIGNPETDFVATFRAAL